MCIEAAGKVRFSLSGWLRVGIGKTERRLATMSE
jgi:hypothetical protein